MLNDKQQENIAKELKIFCETATEDDYTWLIYILKMLNIQNECL